MSKFTDNFHNYCNYINNNGKDSNYMRNVQIYRKEFLDTLSIATPLELAMLIEKYQFIIFVEDGYELYKKYFELGQRDAHVLSLFLEYLWFWGDHDEAIPKLKTIIEQSDSCSLERIIEHIITKGLSGIEHI